MVEMMMTHYVSRYLNDVDNAANGQSEKSSFLPCFLSRWFPKIIFGATIGRLRLKIYLFYIASCADIIIHTSEWVHLQVLKPYLISWLAVWNLKKTLCSGRRKKHCSVYVKIEMYFRFKGQFIKRILIPFVMYSI